MLVTFSSKAHSNVIMFGDMAQTLITMMEFATDVPGAIKAEDVASALANLEKNIALVKQQQASCQDVESSNDNDNDNDNNDNEPEISITVRAMPLIDLLKSAISVKSYVMWQ